jgi:Cytochrome P460
MTMWRSAAGAAAVGIFAIAGAVVQVQAGGEKVMLPEALGTLYTTVDRADNKQYRELYVSPAAAIEAAKKGEPLPSGTVLTLVQYAAQLDAQGSPVKDANGRFIKTNVVGYTVMEKRTGWGTEYPDDIRNGEWEYQAFTADKKVNEKAVLANCFKCHKPLDKQDFVFSYDKLKAPSAAR